MTKWTDRVAVRDQVRRLWGLALASAGHRPPDDWSDDRTFNELGGDSTGAVALDILLGEAFGRRPAGSVVYSHPTVAAQVDVFTEPRAAEGGAVEARTTGVADHSGRPDARPQRVGRSVPAVAIVSAAIRVPGAATLAAFWDLVRSGRATFAPPPADRGGLAGEIGCYLDDVQSFDPGFFGISRTDATWMDPQQRLALELSWEALEAGGQADRIRCGARTGVFVGAGRPDFDDLTAGETRLNGSLVAMIANRVSYCFDLSGPSEVVDTACSSSAVAVARACTALLAGDCDAALAGGISVLLTDRRHRLMRANSMISPTGRCSPFAGSADGMVPGEGGGMVLLKRLADAERDGDPILAILSGWAVNSDGRSNGINAPSPQAQRNVVAAAWRRAGVGAGDVGLVEAHGTGTPGGDPIELGALADVCATAPAGGIAVGSVKGQIGHLEWAAGIVGLIKAALSVARGEIPPSGASSAPPDPVALPAGAPLRIPTQVEPWRGRRVAGVSSFGAGGTNAHLVVESRPVETGAARSGKHLDALLTISAPTERALLGRLRALRDGVARTGTSDQAGLDAVRAMSRGRGDFALRAVVYVAAGHSLPAVLGDVLAGDVVAGSPLVMATRPQAGPVSLALVVADGGEALAGAWVRRGLHPTHRIDVGTARRLSRDAVAELARQGVREVVYAGDASSLGELPDCCAAVGLRLRRAVDPDSEDRSQAVRFVRELHLAGHQVRLDLVPALAYDATLLPTYPFDRARCWPDLTPTPTPTPTPVTGVRPFRQRWLPAAGDIRREPAAATLILAGAGGRWAEAVRAVAPGIDVRGVVRGDSARSLHQPLAPADVTTYIDDAGSPLDIVWLAGLPDGRDRPWEMQVDHGPAGLLAVARAVARSRPRAPVRLVVVTRQAYALRVGDTVDAAQRMSAALVPVLRRELPAPIEVLGVDVAARTSTDELAGTLIDFAAARGWDAISARRDQRWLTPAWAELDVEDSAAVVAGRREAGRYLVTGGFGALGTATCEWLAGRGASHLHVVCRGPVPERAEWPADLRLARFAALEQRGVAIVVHIADVADAAAMADVVAQVRGGGGVTGVVHTAGTVADRSVAAFEPVGFAARLRAKVDGARILDMLFADDDLELFLLYGSAVGAVGNPGQSEYIAANAYLDALAEQRHARGAAALSVAWSSWSGAGMATESGFLARSAAVGLAPISPAEALGALSRASSAGLPTLCIAGAPPGSGDHPAVVPTTDPPIANLPSAPAAAAESAAGAGVPVGVPVDGNGAGAALTVVIDALSRRLQERSVDPDANLFELGATSLDLVAVVGTLNENLGTALPAVTAFEAATARRLAATLAAHLRATTAPARSGVPARPRSGAAEATTGTAVGGPATDDEPIAVIGMSCRFAGAGGVDEFWQLLVQGRCAVRPVRPGELLGPMTPGRHAGLLDSPYDFDPLVFRIAPGEVASIDPQQRLALELCYEALEDAGHAGADRAGTGVYLGAEPTRFSQHGAVQRHSATGGANSAALVANRVSYSLRLGGPSLVCDTACSSAAVAVHLAASGLRRGECGVALAGGVKVLVDHRGFDVNEAAGLLSPTGRLRAFGAGADGYVRGEGGGVLVLRLLRDAVADGDRILAVIAASRLSHDAGDKVGLTAPSGAAQQRLLDATWSAAGVGPDELAFIEAHGTGTALGDAVEARALDAALARLGGTRRPWLGSVKGAIGHTEAAAAAAGLIKAVLSLRHGLVPPHPLAGAATDAIDWANAHFALPRRPTSIEPGAAAVSAFGFGGTNVHLVLRPAPSPAVPIDDAAQQLVVLSACTPAALARLRTALLDRIDTGTPPRLLDIAATLAVGRPHLPVRTAHVVADLADLRRALLAPGVDPIEAAARDLAAQVPVLAELSGPERPRALADLRSQYLGGAAIEWPAVYAGTNWHRVALPTYPFERRTFRPASVEAAAPEPTATLARLRWVDLDEQADPPAARPGVGNWTVLGASPPLQAAVERQLRMAGLDQPAAGPAELLWLAPVPRGAGDAMAWTTLLQTCRAMRADGRRHVCAVLPLSGGEPDPRAALASGLLLGWADETPGLRLTVLHLDLDRPADAVARGLVDGLGRLAGTGEFWMRGQGPGSRLAALRVTELDPRDLRRRDVELGTVLVTGGFGGIGRRLAGAVAELGASDVVLLGRGDPTRAEPGCAAVRAGGARAHVAIADLRDEPRLAAVVADLRARHGRIGTVIHAAGTFDHVHRSLGRKTPASIAEVVAAKVDGFATLERLLADDPPDLVVHCTSISASGSGLAGGQADYAAANAALDAAARRSDHGDNTLAIGWSQWDQVGMSAGRPLSSTAVERGLAALPVEQAVRAFRDLLQIGARGHVLVLAGTAGRDALRTYVADSTDSRTAPTSGTGRRAATPAEPPTAAPSTSRGTAAAATHAVHRALAGVLGANESELPVDMPFVDLGVDSLAIADLAGALERDLGVLVDPADVLLHPTVSALAAHLAALAPVRAVEATPVRAVPPTVGPATRPTAEPHTPPAPELRPVPVAVIGVAGRFPGADGVAELWERVAGSRPAITEIPPQRWDCRAGGHPDGTSRWGGFLDRPGAFDHDHFGLSAAEAELLDPLQRLFLEAAWSALRDAGYGRGAPARCGVFVGARAPEPAAQAAPAPLSRGSVVGYAQNFIAARVAHHLDLRGPALVVDTACSSSLVAVHLALQSLAAGECDTAVAGGVDLLTGPGVYASLSAAGALSPRGVTSTFGREADGYVPGEGAGAVVLKPLAAALRDGDRVYAVIRGSAVNNDGRTVGLTTPSVVAQREVLAAAYERAGVDAGTIGLVETHGTATAIGDPIEVRALRDTLATDARRGDCALSSAKATVGHLHSAAGVVGLLVAVCALHHRTRPPAPVTEGPNPRLDLDNAPFRLLPRATPWASDGPRRAAVSAFGFGGTNCHAVLEGAPPRPAPPGDTEPVPTVLLAGRSTEGLRRAARSALVFLAGLDAGAELAAHAAAVSDGSSPGPVRASVRGPRTDLLDRLEALAAGRAPGRAAAERPRVVFMFPGQGAQFAGMYNELARRPGPFADALDECADWFAPYLATPLRTLLADADGQRLRATSNTQPALFAVEYALDRLWRALGVTPFAVIGHSIGEYAALVSAGVVSGTDAARLVVHRATAMAACPAGSMLAVPLSESAIRDRLGDALADVDVAAVNAAHRVVLSGPRDAIDRLGAALRRHGVAAAPLRVSHAFHSRLMEPASRSLSGIAAATAFRPGRATRFVSPVTGAIEDNIDAAYLSRQVREPVRFADAVAAAVAAGGTAFVELGPGTALSELAGESVPAGTPTVGGVAHRRSERDSLLAAAADLWEHGVDVRLRPLLPAGPELPILPVHPFERVDLGLGSRAVPPSPRHPGDDPRDAATAPANEHRYLDGASVEGAVLIGTRRFAADTPVLSDHTVRGHRILPGVSWLTAVCDLIGAGEPVAGWFRDVTFVQALHAEAGTARTARIRVEPVGTGGRHPAGTLTFVAEDADGTRFARGRFEPGRPGLHQIDVSALAAECPQALTADEVYARIRAQGIRHGDHYRCISSVTGGTGQAVAWLVAPEGPQPALSPALLDGATTVGAAVAGHAPWRSGEAYIPLHIDTLSVAGELPRQVVCAYRVSPLDGELSVFDFDLATPDGRVVVSARRFASKRVPVQWWPGDGPSMALPLGRIAWVPMHTAGAPR
jgi:acyl transferase domain-containing protein/NAD(P)-dependent dehydrogenase (short-subunit alcohol dehydrogenase family)/acyl carrier protein